MSTDLSWRATICMFGGPSLLIRFLCHVPNTNQTVETRLVSLQHKSLRAQEAKSARGLRVLGKNPDELDKFIPRRENRHRRYVGCRNEKTKKFCLEMNDRDV